MPGKGRRSFSPMDMFERPRGPRFVRSGSI
jgi:hypothetical protein